MVNIVIFHTPSADGGNEEMSMIQNTIPKMTGEKNLKSQKIIAVCGR